jgi:hypothetical protein
VLPTQSGFRGLVKPPVVRQGDLLRHRVLASTEPQTEPMQRALLGRGELELAERGGSVVQRQLPELLVGEKPPDEAAYLVQPSPFFRNGDKRRTCGQTAPIGPTLSRYTATFRVKSQHNYMGTFTYGKGGL